MPNHCQNYLVLSHPDVRQIGRAKLAILDDKFFSEFVPCPDDLLREGAASHGGPNAAEYEKIRKENLAKHGYASWYEWAIATWGTKWDAYDIELIDETYDSEGGHLTVTFDTAWAPPCNFYTELVEQGFGVDAMYHEFGCAFGGQYVDGTDMYFEYDRDTLDNIPKEVDEQFGITDTLAEWDAYDEEEEEEEA